MNFLKKILHQLNGIIVLLNTIEKHMNMHKMIWRNMVPMITWRQGEARRDFYTGMIKEIKRLEHIDSTPNLELKEPKWEIYKITITNYFFSVDSLSTYLPSSQNPGNHCVLLQNADGNINMGVWYDDPARDVYDVAWFGILSLEMETASKTEGLISRDEEFDTTSCFVELQRN